MSKKVIIEPSILSFDFGQLAHEAKRIELAKADAIHVDIMDGLFVNNIYPQSVVRACAALVKPGGWVFFSTINRSPKSFLFAIVGAEYVLNLLPRGTHAYKKLIRPAELAGFARDCDLSLLHTRGMGYNPFNRRYALTSDTSVNYLFATQKGL
jgi:ubiquinone biosynthesis O-methyltransferase